MIDRFELSPIKEMNKWSLTKKKVMVTWCRFSGSDDSIQTCEEVKSWTGGNLELKHNLIGD